MKKLILSLLAIYGLFSANAQVIFYAEAPAAVVGNYDFTYAKPTQSWGSPDMTLPANAITDTLMLASDGTTADSLLCNPATNNLTGKIAVLYRGACQFGTKALDAQNAGAIGVIIINNVPGSPIEMNGGTDGPSVTIPVVMVSDATGATLVNAMAGNDVVVFIGSKTGFYGDDLGFYKKDILRAEEVSIPSMLAQNATEYSVPNLGAWVFNYGSNDQTNVTVTVDITLNGNSIYNQTSAATSILSGDSAYFTLPAFSQTSYTVGYYYMNYSISSNATDQFTADNLLESDFLVDDSTYALSRIVDTTMLPANMAYYRPSGGTGAFTECIKFRDLNASRMQLDGIWFSASGGNTPQGLSGEYIEVAILEWTDNFTDLNDANAPTGGAITYTQIGGGSYTYGSDLQNANVYAPVTQQSRLQDDQRYLFCVTTYNDSVYLGFDTEIDYTQNVNTYLQPLFPISDNGTWYLSGFGYDVVPAIAAQMSANTVGIEDHNEVEVTPYPNPARDIITIPVGSRSGSTSIVVTDLTGKVVLRQPVNAVSGNITVDVSSLSNGNYVFNMNFEDGTHSKFKVVVTK